MKNEEFITEVIKDTVLAYYNTTFEEIDAKNRKRGIVKVRQVMHYFLKLKTEVSLSNIGIKAGGLNHATVLYSKKIVENILSYSQKFRDEIHEIENLINDRLSKANILTKYKVYEIRDLDRVIWVCAKNLLQALDVYMEEAGKKFHTLDRSVDPKMIPYRDLILYKIFDPKDNSESPVIIETFYDYIQRAQSPEIIASMVIKEEQIDDEQQICKTEQF